jgi:hypothetical protein
MSLATRNFVPVLHEVIARGLRDIWIILLHFKGTMGGVADKITLKWTLLKEKGCNGEGYIPSSPGSSFNYGKVRSKLISKTF